MQEENAAAIVNAAPGGDDNGDDNGNDSSC